MFHRKCLGPASLCLCVLLFLSVVVSSVEALEPSLSSIDPPDVDVYQGKVSLKTSSLSSSLSIKTQAQPVSFVLDSKTNIYTFTYATYKTRIYETVFQGNIPGLEYEIVFSQDPRIPTVNFNLDSKGLLFYYQPSLLEELNLKAYDFVNDTHAYVKEELRIYRPLYIVGSYAVYDVRGLKQFHIYRPFLIDSKGATQHVEMVYNEFSGQLIFSLPPEFMRTASYPVTLDPSFGYMTQGGTGVYKDSSFYGCKFTLTENGNITNIGTYTYNSNTPGFACIYSDVGGTPTTRLTYSAVLTAPSWPPWHNYPMSYVADAGVYWLILFTGGDEWYVYDAGNTNQYTYDPYPSIPYTGNPPPESAPGVSFYNRVMTIWANYTVIEEEPELYIADLGLSGRSAFNGGTHSTFNIWPSLGIAGSLSSDVFLPGTVLITSQSLGAMAFVLALIAIALITLKK